MSNQDIVKGELPGGADIVEYLHANIKAYLNAWEVVYERFDRLGRILGNNEPQPTNFFDGRGSIVCVVVKII